MVNWTLQKAHVRVWTSGLQQHQVFGCCEHGRKALDIIAARDFLATRVSDFQRTVFHEGHGCSIIWHFLVHKISPLRSEQTSKKLWQLLSKKLEEFQVSTARCFITNNHQNQNSMKNAKNLKLKSEVRSEPVIKCNRTGYFAGFNFWLAISTVQTSCWGNV
jgi:hypothetical protein